jgi:hypothetical protein
MASILSFVVFEEAEVNKVQSAKEARLEEV